MDSSLKHPNQAVTLTRPHPKTYSPLGLLHQAREPTFRHGCLSEE